MHLKPYQQDVLDDLARYLDLLRAHGGLAGPAFRQFWQQHPRTPLTPTIGRAVKPYASVVPGAPHLCVKVPTGGGKTYIAAAALRVIFEATVAGAGLPPVVVWLVPSRAILDQTLGALRDPQHPYRRRLLADFGGRLEVFDKEQLNQGAVAYPDPQQRQLTVVVMSFASLRATNKEDRKVNQENGHYPVPVGTGPDAVPPLPGTDDTAAINALRRLRPVVIVDESHNAESDLSVEMLRNLNPGFVLDLTATPKSNSNLLCFVDALALKQEHMVKLPVIVYNHHDRTGVIGAALHLRHQLETAATVAHAGGQGPYIRPIILFQAQPRTPADAADADTYEQVRTKLVEAGVPKAHIAIKTATVDELRGVDLLAPTCAVRYIITVNALKEGWDCPFAYVLASLANRSSAVDVEQIVGRVLRQPYARPVVGAPMLNMSYVLTASANFLATLNQIVAGLNRAGFSDRDYRVADVPEEAAPGLPLQGQQADMFAALAGGTAAAADASPVADVNVSELAAIVGGAASPQAAAAVAAIMEQAETQAAALTQTLTDAQTDPTATIPAAVRADVQTNIIKAIFRPDAAALHLPQFVKAGIHTALFPEPTQLLSWDHLLTGFNLAKADLHITFDEPDADLYRINLEEQGKGEYALRFARLDHQLSEEFLRYLRTATPQGRIQTLASNLVRHMGTMAPISEADLRGYVERVLATFTPTQHDDLLAREDHYARRLKAKINQLAEDYAEKAFRDQLDTDRIGVEPRYTLPVSKLLATGKAVAITKSLYEKEIGLNGFEEAVIDKVANLPNVLFWTRNEKDRGFRLNGGVFNHWPDFLVVTKAGRIVVLETKGDDRDNSSTAKRIRLGRAWATKAGNQYRYCMVFDQQQMEDAYTLSDFLEKLKAW